MFLSSFIFLSKSDTFKMIININYTWIIQITAFVVHVVSISSEFIVKKLGPILIPNCFLGLNFANSISKKIIIYNNAYRTYVIFPFTFTNSLLFLYYSIFDFHYAFQLNIWRQCWTGLYSIKMLLIHGCVPNMQWNPLFLTVQHTLYDHNRWNINIHAHCICFPQPTTSLTWTKWAIIFWTLYIIHA